MLKKIDYKFCKIIIGLMLMVGLIFLAKDAKMMDASAQGQITTANKTYVKTVKVKLDGLNSGLDGINMALLSNSINITAPGVTTANGDMYTVTYNFTKKSLNGFRLLNVYAYIEKPYFFITQQGGANQINNTDYIWDETQQAYVMPNPLVDVNGTSLDTSVASNGTQGTKLYITGANTSIMPYSFLTNNSNATGFRPTFNLDVASMPYDSVQSKSFTLYQERTYLGDSNKWHNFRYLPAALLEYEYDVNITATNPYDLNNLNDGDTAQFESKINMSYCDTVSVTTYCGYQNADMIWQVSTDNGATFTDIPGTKTNTNNAKSKTKALVFTARLNDEGNLYRVKITPNSTDTKEPIYTEAAVLRFTNTSVTPLYYVELDGAQLQHEQFTFSLKNENGDVIETTKNIVNGEVVFSDLSFVKAGTYKYTVEQHNDKQDGIIYDDKIIALNISVDNQLNNKISTSHPDNTFYNKVLANNISSTIDTPTNIPTTGQDNTILICAGLSILATIIISSYVYLRYRKNK